MIATQDNTYWQRRYTRLRAYAHRWLLSLHAANAAIDELHPNPTYADLHDQIQHWRSRAETAEAKLAYAPREALFVALDALYGIEHDANVRLAAADELDPWLNGAGWLDANAPEAPSE
jgi:hypothetical protein